MRVSHEQQAMKDKIKVSEMFVLFSEKFVFQYLLHCTVCIFKLKCKKVLKIYKEDQWWKKRSGSSTH